MNETIQKNDLNQEKMIINSNDQFLKIIKNKEYDILKNSKIKLQIEERKTLIEIIDILLKDEYILYYMYKNDFSFSKEEMNSIFKIVSAKYKANDYELSCFFTNFFKDIESLNEFVKEHEKFFINYIHDITSYLPSSLDQCDNLTELILKEKCTHLIQKLNDYSVSNLKLLATQLKNGMHLPYYLGNNTYIKHLFELKDSLEKDEFFELLGLVKDINQSNTKTLNELINTNIDYLIEGITEIKNVSICLATSEEFRDELIKRDKIDLAVQCLLPENIFENDNLAMKYCNQLGITPKDFYARGKWVLDYYKKNNNIFNSMLSTMLKDDIFNLGEEHIERFSNDISVQMDINKLDEEEIKILKEILKKYNYEEYDISFMVTNILHNIKDYKELNNKLDINNITDKEINSLIRVLQVPKNPYNITNTNDLMNYKNIKEKYFVENYSNDNLNYNKDNLLKLVFNCSFNEAQYINNKFCYDDEKCVLEQLKSSELDKNILDYLTIINKIVESNNFEDIVKIYNSYKDSNIYDNEIPLETYLRSEYTKLYSDSLYKIKDKTNTYGPTDNIYQSINYNGKDIKVHIPREKFNFLVHCVGSCSLKKDIIDSNYKTDWEDRPQIQDHFVACSYINEKKIYSIRSGGSIIMGFSSIENSSILGMGDSDIDSIGYFAKSYNSSIDLMEGNRNRAHYYVPSLLTSTKNDSYNEIVIERRNYNKEKKNHFKKTPDYIIMMADSLEKNNLKTLKDLYNKELSFISNEDKELISNTSSQKDIKKILDKYKEVDDTDNTSLYTSLILEAKYLEDCLKASSEFDIDLVVIDRKYYLEKMLYDSFMYDDATINKIINFYENTNDYNKKLIYNKVARGLDVVSVLEQKNQRTITQLL